MASIEHLPWIIRAVLRQLSWTVEKLQVDDEVYSNVGRIVPWWYLKW